MGSCSSFFLNEPTENNNNNYNNLMDPVEQFRWFRSCPHHRGNDLISLCFSSRFYYEAFHCKICEEICPYDRQGHSHVSLSHLNQDVDKETIIPNWPVLSQHVLSRISFVLSISFEDEIEQIDNNQTTISSLKQLQIRLQDTYHSLSQQKEFRDILSKDFLDHKQKSVQVIRVINFIKDYKKYIDEEFISLLNDFDILKNKFQFKLNHHKQNCSELKHNKMDERYQQEDNSEQKRGNIILQSDNENEQGKLKIPRFSEIQNYENNNRMKEKESIFYEISRIPNLNHLKLDFQQAFYLSPFTNQRQILH